VALHGDADDAVPSRVRDLVALHGRALWTSALAELPRPTSWSSHHESISLQSQLLELCPAHVSRDVLEAFAPVLVDLACRAAADVQSHFVTAFSGRAPSRAAREIVTTVIATPASGLLAAASPPRASGAEQAVESARVSQPVLRRLSDAVAGTLAPLSAVLEAAPLRNAPAAAADAVRDAASDFLGRICQTEPVVDGSTEQSPVLRLPGWCHCGSEAVEAVATTVAAAAALLVSRRSAGRALSLVSLRGVMESVRDALTAAIALSPGGAEPAAEAEQPVPVALDGAPVPVADEQLLWVAVPAGSASKKDTLRDAAVARALAAVVGALSSLADAEAAIDLTTPGNGLEVSALD
jgi:hypothetical protein